MTSYFYDVMNQLLFAHTDDKLKITIKKTHIYILVIIAKKFNQVCVFWSAKIWIPIYLNKIIFCQQIKIANNVIGEY